MKISFYASILVAATVLSACATIHPGTKGTLISGSPSKIIVSAKKQKDFSDHYYTFVTITTEDKTDDMLRITSSDIEFDKPNLNTASVLVGPDLLAWAEANEEEMKKAEQNRKLAQLGLLLGGLAVNVAGVASHNSALADAGVVTAAAGAGWAGASEIHNHIRNAQNPRLVPHEHIYSPYSVPAGKFIRRWVVFQHHENEKIRKIFLHLTFEDGTAGTYEMAL